LRRDRENRRRADAIENRHQPAFEGVMAASIAELARRRGDCPWYVAALEAALVAIVVWNVVELGFLEASKPWPAFIRQ
jgi:hypothetical protein